MKLKSSLVPDKIPEQYAKACLEDYEIRRQLRMRMLLAFISENKTEYLKFARSGLDSHLPRNS